MTNEKSIYNTYKLNKPMRKKSFHATEKMNNPTENE